VNRHELVSLLRAQVRVAVRRARTDQALLIAQFGFVALASLLAVLGPGLLLSTIDGGVRDEVRAAGSAADVEVRMAVGDRGQNRPASLTPDEAIDYAAELPATLPPGLGSVDRVVQLSVLSPYASIRDEDGDRARDDYDLQVRPAMLVPGDAESVDVVEGRLPEPADDVVEIVMARGTADAGGIAVGDRLGAWFAPGDRAERDGDNGPVLDYLVVGLVEPRDADDERWSDRSSLWETQERSASSAEVRFVRMTALAVPEGMLLQAEQLRPPLEGIIRIRLDVDAVTAERAETIGTEVRGLVVDAEPLSAGTGAVIDVRTGLGDVLGAYPVVARAALAQMSVMMAGVIGIAAVVQVLLAGLIIGRRSGALALERARGASLTGIAGRTLLESGTVAVAGVVVGLALSQIVFPGRIAEPGAALVGGLIAALAAPVIAVARVLPLWAGRRTPANRDARRRLAGRRRSRRLVVELAVILLAVAALYALRDRGLLQARTGGIDPLLAAAPLLACVAVAIVILRLFPYPVRLISRIGRRDRGVLGLLAAVRAQQGLALAPLLALTLGTALATSGGLLVETVRGGLDEAAWDRVGADVRVDAAVSSTALEEVRAAEGVAAASATSMRVGVGIDFGTTTVSATVLGVDESYGAVVESLPTGGDGTPYSALVGVETDDPEAPLPAVLDERLARSLTSDTIAMYFGPDYVELRVVGVVPGGPEGYAAGPFAFVDLEGLALRTDPAVTPTRVLVMGEGAMAATDALNLPDDSVTGRAEWITDRRGLSIVAGVEATMLLATISAVLLAAIALVATVVGGARERGRTLAMLRTLGMRPRLGWWLALAELLPVVIAAIIGGTAAGVLVVLSLAPALGLDVLAGGLAVPEPAIAPGVFLGIAGGAIVLLGVGVLADVLVHRRERLNEVLRVGETV